jgi:phenylacetate-CoA ligase
MDYILRYLIFPSLDTVTGCLRRLLFLKRLQWDQRLLERWLDERVHRLVVHAYSTVPYYRQTYRKGGIDPSKIRKAEDICSLPIVTKDELKRNSLHKTRSTAVPQFRNRLTHTSGSTGQMFDFYDDKNVRGYVIASRLLFESWMGMTAGDITVHPSISDWRFRPMGGVRIPVSRLDHDPVSAVRLIRSFRPAALTGNASVLSSLAYGFLRIGVDAKMNLKAAATTAEILLPRDRELISRAFDCPVYDRYGLSEVAGYVAQECSAHQGLHVNGGMATVQVVKDGQVCGPGETGRLIVTNLHNYAMPFIRYDTGDLATVGNACSCGRAFPTLTRIKGRASHWIQTQSLPVSWTLFMSSVQDLNIMSIEQYQFIQTDVGELRLLIAPKSALTTTQMVELKKRLNAVHTFVKVNVEAVDSIEPGAGGKRVLFKPLQSASQLSTDSFRLL